jgi:hypothetical protein
MNANPNSETVREFLDAFEEVFDRDWSYTKQMLGIRVETEDQKKALGELGLETAPIIAEDGTFVRPRVADEVEDWGNRGRLLAAYRAVKELCREA